MLRFTRLVEGLSGFQPAAKVVAYFDPRRVHRRKVTHIRESCAELHCVRSTHRIIVSLSQILQEVDTSPVYSDVAALIVEGSSIKLPDNKRPINRPKNGTRAA
jgi:hypothetical protein